MGRGVGAGRRTVHLVYPHRDRISAPDSIGRNLAARLGNGYDVVLHDWDARYQIKPNPGDILIGHPHPDSRTVFQASASSTGWSRRLALSPYNEDPFQVAFLDAVIDHCDLYLAITGPYWFRRINRSLFSHWAPKMRRLDMAVDRSDFPPVKARFAPAGERRILYIGHTARMKNVGYLGEIARSMPTVSFGRIGPPGKPIDGVTDLGWRDFSTSDARSFVSTFDFLISTSRYDANPTTILEAMAWGLIPVCTPQSGYESIPGIPNIPLDDPQRAAQILVELQHLPQDDLLEMQRLNWRRLDREHTWESFAANVLQSIESGEAPVLLRTAASQRAALRLAAFISPYNGPARRLARRAKRWVVRRRQRDLP